MDSGTAVADGAQPPDERHHWLAARVALSLGVTTAAAMAWEAARIGTPERARLAQLVLTHRVLPADPLAVSAADDGAAAEAAILDHA